MAGELFNSLMLNAVDEIIRRDPEYLSKQPVRTGRAAPDGSSRTQSNSQGRKLLSNDAWNSCGGPTFHWMTLPPLSCSPPRASGTPVSAWLPPDIIFRTFNTAICVPYSNHSLSIAANPGLWQEPPWLPLLPKFCLHTQYAPLY